MNNVNTDQTMNLYKRTIQIILATLIVIGITVYVERNHISTIFEAGNKEKEVTIAFYPNTISQPQGSKISLTPIVTSLTKKVGYMDLRISFNRARLEFTGIDNSPLNEHYEAIMLPDQISANADGKIDVIYSVKDEDFPISGPIELSRFHFIMRDLNENVVTIDTETSQIIFDTESDDEELADIVVKEAKINFISPLTPTPSIKMTPSTSIPEQITLTPTLSESKSPTVTALPSVQVTSPQIEPTTSATSSSVLNH